MRAVLPNLSNNFLYNINYVKMMKYITYMHTYITCLLYVLLVKRSQKGPDMRKLFTTLT
mgnify:FL=1